jgi:hypothetical protein
MARPHAASQIPPKLKKPSVARSCEFFGFYGFLDVGRPSTQDASIALGGRSMLLAKVVFVICHWNLV